MTTRLLVGILALVVLPGCSTTLNVQRLEPGQAGVGLVYRLPKPMVKITIKTTETELYDIAEYTAKVVAVPTQNFRYAVTVQNGAFSKDEVGINLSEGGVFQKFNLTTADQTQEVIKELGSLLVAAAKDGARMALEASNKEVEAAKAQVEAAQAASRAEATEKDLNQARERSKGAKGRDKVRAQVEVDKAEQILKDVQEKARVAQQNADKLRKEAEEARAKANEALKPREVKPGDVVFPLVFDGGAKEIRGGHQFLKKQILHVLAAYEKKAQTKPLTEEEITKVGELLGTLRALDSALNPKPAGATQEQLIEIKVLESDQQMEEVLKTMVDKEFIALARPLQRVEVTPKPPQLDRKGATTPKVSPGGSQ